MRFVSHPDPRVLVDWLRSDIAAQRSRDPLGSIHLITPNRRLAIELRRLLAEGGRSYLGMRVQHLWALVSEIVGAGEGSGVRPGLAPDSLLRAEAQRCLLEAGGRLGTQARQRPGLAGRLLATFEELREAGVSEEDVTRLLRLDAAPAGDGEAGADALGAYVLYLAALRRLAGAGYLDRTGFVQLAQQRASDWARGARAVYLYGAYELIGAHLALLRSIAAVAPVVCLLPLGREGRCWEHGSRFARQFLCDEAERIEYLDEPARSPWARAARVLYEEEAAGPDGGELEIFHAQGAEAELTGVARRILDLNSRDVPLRGIGVVARTLHPYAPHLARIFESHGIPFSTSATQPLRRFPAGAALLGLLRVLARDFEREDLLTLLRSPDVRWPAGAQPRADLLERWSGESGIRRGFSSWSRDLPEAEKARLRDAASRRFEDSQEAERFVAARAGALEQQMRILEELGREAAAWSRCSSLAGHAAFVGELAGRWIRGLSAAGTDPAAAMLLEILQELRITATLQGGEGGAASPDAMVELIEGLIGSRSLPLRDPASDGVRVLDGMQARGHVFDTLFLCGFNAGVFPMRVAEDPFLSEPRRRWLRDEARRPVPLRDNLAEERQLLALWIHSAGARLIVSYRRADDDGRAEIPSFALREVARAATGRPDAPSLAARAAAIPVHPQQRILHWAVHPGIVDPREAALLVALGPGNQASRLREHLARTPGGPRSAWLDAALGWMAGREAHLSREEGCCGPLQEPDLSRTWSPSRLQEMSRCPLRFFFEHVLGIEPYPEPPLDGRFDPLDWGGRVHSMLQEVYRTLGRESLLEPDAGPCGPQDEARCRELIAAEWEEAFGDLARRVSRRLRVVWEEQARRWIETIIACVIRDVRAWRERRLTLVDLENDGETVLGTPGGGPLRLHGRVDRVAGTPQGGIRITDYKVTRKLDALGAPKEMLRGTYLQAPIYAWIEAARAGTKPPAQAPSLAATGTRPGDKALPGVDVEFLGIHPELEEDPEAARTVVVGAADLERWREGTEETVRTLAGMAAAGWFPFRHDDSQCARCDFDPGCRHRERDARRAVEGRREFEDFFLTRRKTTRFPTLATVRASRADRGARQEEE